MLTAFILATAAATAAPVDVPKVRKDYANCLIALTNDAIDRKQPRDAFLAALKSKCTDKEKTFRDALLVTNKADGMSEAEATQDADEQVAEYIDRMTSDFDTIK